jgi:uncharacterized membrane protein YqiK
MSKGFTSQFIHTLVILLGIVGMFIGGTLYIASIDKRVAVVENSQSNIQREHEMYRTEVLKRLDSLDSKFDTILQKTLVKR